MAGAATSYLYDVNTSLPVLLDDGSRKYVWGLGLTYAVDTAGNVQAYYTDGLGSVRAITDATGNVVQTYQTDEFGVPTQTQGTVSQPFQYTGEQQDAESGFVYLRARYYDPQIGRFLSKDPLRGTTAIPASLNRYTYARNNPTAYIDPSGLDPLDMLLGAYAHRLIELEFTRLHPTYAYEQVIRDGFTKAFIRLDLAEKVKPNTYNFYEIKPVSQKTEGLATIARYRATARGYTPSVDLIRDPMVFPDIWIDVTPTVRLHAWWEAAGLILYQWVVSVPSIVPVPVPFPSRDPNWRPRRTVPIPVPRLA